MAKVTGPLGSIAAAGKLGNAIQFQNWKGRCYVAKRRRPRQPRTESQRAARIMMTFLAQQWHNLTAGQQDTWANVNLEPPNTPYTNWIAENINRYKQLPGDCMNSQNYDVFPTLTYPAAKDTEAGWPFTLDVSGGKHQITHKFNLMWPQDNWLFIYHHASPDLPCPFYANLAAIFVVNQVQDYELVIPNLPAGPNLLYYQRVSSTGKPAWSFTQIAADVTD